MGDQGPGVSTLPRLLAVKYDKPFIMLIPHLTSFRPRWYLGWTEDLPDSPEGPSGKEAHMKESKIFSLNLEVEEIEKREKAGGNCSSSTTSNHCTCMCIPHTTISCDPGPV